MASGIKHSSSIELLALENIILHLRYLSKPVCEKRSLYMMTCFLVLFFQIGRILLFLKQFTIFHTMQAGGYLQ
jgi:hypothetical protein